MSQRRSLSFLISASSSLALLIVFSCNARPLAAQESTTAAAGQSPVVQTDKAQKLQQKRDRSRDERARSAEQEAQRVIQQAIKDARPEDQEKLREGLLEAQKGLSELKSLGTLIPPYAYRFATGIPDGLFGTPDKRVDVDLRRLSVEDALRKVFQTAQVEYELDADLPEETCISLQATNVRLATVVELLTQAAGVKWTMEMRRGADGKSLKTTYHIGKVSHDVLKNPMDVSVYTGNTPPVPSEWPGWSGRPEPAFPPNVPDTASFNVPGVGFNSPSGGGRTYIAGPGTRYLSVTIEERATFICPHCKGHIVVLRPRTQPRTNGEGPRQSTKRAAAEWKFCPLCGKPLEFEKKADTHGRDEGDGPCGKTLYGSLMSEEKMKATCTKLPIDYRFENSHDRF